MTSKSILLLGITVLTFSLFSQKSYGQTSELEEAKKAIAASNAVYWDSYPKNDPCLFINSYTKDACLLEPGKPIRCGVEVLAEFFDRTYKAGTRNGEFITQEIFGVGDGYVAEIGLIKTVKENGEKGEGKYLVLWKKTPGGWKMFRDAFNGNR